jgi:hypothetical protein
MMDEQGAKFDYAGTTIVIRGETFSFVSGSARAGSEISCRLYRRLSVGGAEWCFAATKADLPRWVLLLADAEGDLLARQANHAHLSAVALDELAESKKRTIPEHRLKAKLRASPEHYRREIEIAEAHRSVVFLRAIVAMLQGAAAHV